MTYERNMYENEESIHALSTLIQGFSGSLYAFRGKREESKPVEFNLLENVDDYVYDFLSLPSLAYSLGPREISPNDNGKLLALMHAGVAFTILNQSDGSILRGNFYGGISRSGSEDFQDSKITKVIHSTGTENRISIPLYVNLHLIRQSEMRPYFDLWITYTPLNSITLTTFNFNDTPRDIHPRISSKDTEFKQLSKALGNGSRDLSYFVPNIYYPKE